jgi:hypothetical protein
MLSPPQFAPLSMALLVGGESMAAAPYIKGLSNLLPIFTLCPSEVFVV